MDSGSPGPLDPWTERRAALTREPPAASRADVRQGRIPLRNGLDRSAKRPECPNSRALPLAPAWPRLRYPILTRHTLPHSAIRSQGSGSGSGDLDLDPEIPIRRSGSADRAPDPDAPAAPARSAHSRGPDACEAPGRIDYGGTSLARFSRPLRPDKKRIGGLSSTLTGYQGISPSVGMTHFPTC